MGKSRKKFLCLDCRIDTGKAKEHYFVYTELWLSVVGSNKGMLCVSCLERRLKRQLQPCDFPHVYINDPSFEPKSKLLLSRIGGHHD